MLISQFLENLANGSLPDLLTPMQKKVWWDIFFIPSSFFSYVHISHTVGIVTRKYNLLVLISLGGAVGEVII